MCRRLLPVLVALLSLGAGPLYAQSGALDGYLTRGRELAKAGKADQALPYFSLSLELAEARFGADDPALVPFIDALAGAQVAGKNYRDAETLYQRALRIQEREATPYQTGIVRTLNKIGKIYEATERSRDALDLYRRVITVWAPVLGGDHPDVKAAGGRLARLALRVPFEVAPAEPAKGEPAKTERQVVRLVPMPTRKPVPKAIAKPSPPVAARAPPAAARPPPAAAQTPPGPAAGDARHALHLTSIRDPRDAPGEWARLRRLYGGLLADLALQVIRADLGAKRGIYYRIKGGFLARPEARARCAALAARGAWCQVTGPQAGGGPGRAARDALVTPPVAPPVAPPAAPPRVADAGAGAEGFRVHLTSIRDPGNAEAEWRRLRRRHGRLLEGLRLTVARVDLGPGRGIYYRVQGGEMTRQQARSLCAALSARKIWCRVVRPGSGDTAVGPQRLALQRGRRRPARHRGTRRGHTSMCPPCPRRDRGCRRSPFAALFA